MLVSNLPFPLSDSSLFALAAWRGRTHEPGSKQDNSFWPPTAKNEQQTSFVLQSSYHLGTTISPIPAVVTRHVGDFSALEGCALVCRTQWPYLHKYDRVLALLSR